MSYWLDEFNVSKAKSCIPISSVCNVSCVFCSNKYNPFILPNPEFRDIEDIKKNIKSATFDKAIRLSDNIPGRIKEGESLLHPRLFEIIESVREISEDAYIAFTTNGSMLTEKLVLNLSLYKPISIDTLSINTCNEDKWIDIMRGSREQAKIAINAPQLLDKYDIPYTASIVALPEITGYDDIRNTIEYVNKYNCSSFYIWLPGYTDKTPEEVKKLMSYDLNTIYNIIYETKHNINMDIHILPGIQENKLIPRLEAIYEKYKNDRNLVLTSEAAYQYIYTYFKDKGSNFIVKAVTNYTYGGNIKVAGLLFTKDFYTVIENFFYENKNKEINNILIPSEPFDLDGRDLMYEHYYNLKSIGKKCYKVYIV